MLGVTPMLLIGGNRPEIHSRVCVNLDIVLGRGATIPFGYGLWLTLDHDRASADTKQDLLGSVVIPYLCGVRLDG